MNGYNPTAEGFAFEERVRTFLALALSTKFSRKELQIKTPSGVINHPFDLFSSELKIIGEVKDDNWRIGYKFPQGKFEGIERDLGFLHLSPVVGYRKLLMLSDDISTQGKSLIEAFLKRLQNTPMLQNIEVWRYDKGDTPEQDIATQVHGPNKGTILKILISE